MSPPFSDADFDALVSAVMETNRGRWFLAEYARRNRQSDTQMLLAAIERLESALARGPAEPPPIDSVRIGLADMAEAIARTKQEIAAMRPDGQFGAIDDATEELDAIVSATEKATSDILLAAEQIQETAWSLREQDASVDACDQLDSRATDVYTACSFQDLTGQRIRKVIHVLRYLESRIDAMINIWGVDPRQGPATMPWRSDGLLNGPAKPGQGLDQADVDMVMGPSAGRGESEASVTAANGTARAATPIVRSECPPVRSAAIATPHSTSQSSVLNTLASMSYEERIGLFT